MKICLLNNLYKPYNRGGAENVTAAMIKSYQADGHEVFLISTRPPNPDLGKNNDCPTFYIQSDFYNLKKKLLGWRLLWHIGELISSKKYQQIKKLLAAEKPDLVISHNLMGLDFKTAQAIKELKIKHQHFLHDIQLLHPSGLIIFGQEKLVNSLAAKIYQATTRFFIGSPELIISPSHWLLEEHRQRGFFKNSKTKITKLENILNIKLPEEATTNYQPQSFKNLLFAGQIESHKGILFLLDAFKRLADPEMTLTIAGNGSLLNQVQKLAETNKRIKFLGRLDNLTLKEKIKEADVLIMPSLCYENYPVIILEARQAGIPVIASNLGGIPETLGKRDRLFNPKDAADLFKKLKT